MTLATEGRAEAKRRWPENHLVPDPFGATGVAESDPYGYNDTAAEAFIDGVLWVLSRLEADDTTEKVKKAVRREMRNRTYDEHAYDEEVFEEGVTSIAGKVMTAILGPKH